MANNASFEALLRYDHWTPNTSTSISRPLDVAAARASRC